MTPYVAVLGTHGWPKNPSREWWHPESAFAAFLRAQNVVPARPEKPFVWSGDLDGIPLLASGNDWEAGAAAAAYYLEDLPYDARNVIAHSHGGQVMLMAAAAGLQLRSLVMVGTPVRKDIERNIAPDAATNISRCLHICDAGFDFWGLTGAMFDFRVSFRRTFRVPGIVSETVKDIGHSGILRDPTKFHLWEDHGWLEWLTSETMTLHRRDAESLGV